LLAYFSSLLRSFRVMKLYSMKVTWEKKCSTSTGAAEFVGNKVWIIIIFIATRIWVSVIWIVFVWSVGIGAIITSGILDWGGVSVSTNTSGLARVRSIYTSGFVPALWGNIAVFGRYPYEALWFSEINRGYLGSTETCQAMLNRVWVFELDIGDIICFVQCRVYSSNVVLFIFCIHCSWFDATININTKGCW